MTEPRRSTRSTRGVNRRLESDDYVVYENINLNKTDGTKSSRQNKANEGATSEIDCICGDTDEDDERVMCECEQCLKWQHVSCVFGVDDESAVPDGYKCFRCDPKRRKISIEPTDKTQEEEQEAQSQTQENGTPEKPKLSKPRKENYGAGLDKVRQSVINGFKTIFVNTVVPEANSKGLLEVEDEKIDSFSLQLSEEIEQALYNHLAIKPPAKSSSARKKTSSTSHDVGAKYRDKFRAISFNLKDNKNPDLRLRIVCRKLTPDQIVTLTSEEMMNPELQKLAESVRKESIRESILKVDDAPRLRKTHKGEEIVEEYGENDKPLNTTTGTTTPPSDQDLSREVSADGDGEIEVAPKLQQGTNYEKYTGDVNDMSYSPPGSPLGEPEGQETSNNEFHDNDNEENGVQEGKDEDDSTYSPSERNAFLDDDDEELQNIIEDDGTAAASDKKNVSLEPGQDLVHIWKGSVIMAGMWQFKGTAYHLSGNVSGWQNLIDLDRPIVINGRLSSSKADDYLVKAKHTKDISGLIIYPDDSESEGFNGLFQYFKTRSKYGVITSGKDTVKDAYIISVDVGEIPGASFLTPPPAAQRRKGIAAVFVPRNSSQASGVPASRTTSATGNTNASQPPNQHGLLDQLMATGAPISSANVSEITDPSVLLSLLQGNSHT